MKQRLILFLILLSASPSFATLGSLFVYEGLLTESNGTPISTPQNLTLQILQGGTCVFYEETQVVQPGADGEFSVIVGTGTRIDATGNTIAHIFATSGNITCADGSQMAVSGPTNRSLRIKVGSVTLSPDVDITSTPFAYSAEKLGDKTASDFVQLSSNITQTRLDSTFNRYTALDKALTIFNSSPGTVSLIVSNGSGQWTSGSISGTGGISVTNSAGAIQIGVSAAAPTGTASGDLTGTYPAPTVSKISGKSIVYSSFLPSQVLKWSGSEWINSRLTFSEIDGVVALNLGGTGASTASGARANLGLGSAAELNAGSASGKVPLIGSTGMTANKYCRADGTGALICDATLWTQGTGYITSADRVGINTSSPDANAKLDVNGSIKIGDSSGGGACSTSFEGHQRYNATEKRMQFCDGANWISIGGLGRCKSGFTLVGTPGESAFCISNAPETDLTWENAIKACRDKSPKATLCSAAEWTSACFTGGLPTPPVDWEWISEFAGDEFGSGIDEARGRIMGGSGVCKNGRYAGSLTSAYKFRCCYH